MREFYFQYRWSVRGGASRVSEASRVTGIYGASGLECLSMLISRLITPLTAAIVAGLIVSQAAHADLLIKIDKSTQRMTVTVGGEQLYDWPVSTGGRGYDTPSGTFKPFRMEIDHYSEEWDNAPMPYSIFFTKTGNAVHGTFELRNLGRAVSHGCIRLSVKNPPRCGSW